jgi:hypothetical protein
MSRSPPLRFLALLLLGWTGSRAVWLAPGWWTPAAEAGGLPMAGAPPGEARHALEAGTPTRPPLRSAAAIAPADAPGPAPPPRRAGGVPAAVREESSWPALSWRLSPGNRTEPRLQLPPSGGAAASSPETAPPRWSFAAWSFLRGGGEPALAPGGTLGGSQAGALARFRLNRDPARPLALAIRLSSPVRRPSGAEAAVGIDWRPSRRIPLHFLAERRQRLGREGRSAFGLTVHGGVSDAPLAGLRVEAYAQAGIVGTRSPDPFADGALRLSVPLGRVRLGAGAWAAAQPGVARLDLGPQASIRLPAGGRNVALAADWRFRIDGSARPGSGPTLTVATDF